MISENIALKRELNRLVNRYFYAKEKTVENESQLYYELDDFANYINELQLKVADQLLAHKDFTKVYLQTVGKKVYLDEELHCICIDSITQPEAFELLMQKNKDYVEGKK